MRKILKFKLAGVSYGLWNDEIQSTRSDLIIYSIPYKRSNQCMAGITWLDDRYLSIADLSACLGYAPLKKDNRIFLLLPTYEEVLGFAIPGGIEHVEIHSESVHRLPKFARSKVFDTCVVNNLELILLINISELLALVQNLDFVPIVHKLHFAGLDQKIVAAEKGMRRIECGGELFAAQADSMENVIVNPDYVARFGKEQEYINGFIFHNHEVIPLIHLSRRMGLSNEGTANSVLIAHIGGHRIGFLVDADEGDSTVTGTIEALPLLVQSRWMHELLILENSIVPIVDLEALVFPMFSRIDEAALIERYHSDFSNKHIPKEVEVVEFNILDVRHVIPRSEFVDSIGIKSIRHIPNVLPMVLGVAEHENEVLPVLDLAFCYSEISSITAKWKMILVQKGNFRALVVTNSVIGVRTLKAILRRERQIGVPQQFVYGYSIDRRTKSEILILNIENIIAYYGVDSVKEKQKNISERNDLSIERKNLRRKIIPQKKKPQKEKLAAKTASPGIPTPNEFEEEKLKTDKLEAQNQDTRKLAAARLETERLQAEAITATRLNTENPETEKLSVAILDTETLVTKQLEPAEQIAQRQEAEDLTAARMIAENLEAETLVTEQLEAEKLEAARLETEKIITEDQIAKRQEAEDLIAARMIAENLEAETLVTEQLEAEKLVAERIEGERLETEKLASAGLEAEKIKTEEQLAQKQEAEKLMAARLQVEKIEAKRLKAEKLEAEEILAVRPEAIKPETDNLEAEELEKQDLTTVTFTAKEMYAEPALKNPMLKELEAEDLTTVTPAAKETNAELSLENLRLEDLEAEDLPNMKFTVKDLYEELSSEKLLPEASETEDLTANKQTWKAPVIEKPGPEKQTAKEPEVEILTAEKQVTENLTLETVVKDTAQTLSQTTVISATKSKPPVKGRKRNYIFFIAATILSAAFIYFFVPSQQNDIEKAEAVKDVKPTAEVREVKETGEAIDVSAVVEVNRFKEAGETKDVSPEVEARASEKAETAKDVGPEVEARASRETETAKDVGPVTEISKIKDTGDVKDADTVADAKPAAPPSRQTDEIVEYIVKKDDTLFRITKSYTGNGYDYPIVQKENKIPNADLIYPNQLIKIGVEQKKAK